MKIAIISDSHDNVPNIEKFIWWVNNNSIKAVIHCGDICAPAIIKNLLGLGLSCPVHLIHGNVSDRERLAEVVKNFEHVTLHGDLGECDANILMHTNNTNKYEFEKNKNTGIQKNIRIAFGHYPEQAKELAKTGKYDVVFYGHTHRPWDETVTQTRLLNPGTLAGMFYKATFAVYDIESNKADLILLEKL